MSRSREQYSTENKSGKQIFIRRLLLVSMMVFLVAAVTIYRVFELKVIDHRYYALAAHNDQIRIDPVAPPRGLILSRNGRLLADNHPGYSLELIPDEAKPVSTTIARLNRLLGLSSDQLHYFYRQLDASPAYRAVPILTNLTAKQWSVFAVNSWRFPGVFIQPVLQRFYPDGSSMVDSVGYVGRINGHELHKVNATNYAGTDYYGKSGLELEYQPILHGQVGYTFEKVDAVGRPLKVVRTKLPAPGDSLVLTLDVGLERVAEKAMSGWRGAVIALDPRNGAILALVSKPSFDPNWFVNGISTKRYHELITNPGKPMWNRVLSASYAPGSTIKPFIALAALQAGVITPQEKIYSGPYYVIPGTTHKFWDWDQWGHGWTNLTKAIARSVDTYFYPVALKTGIGNIDRMLSQFGFGRPSLPNFPGESSGLLPTPAWKMQHMGQSWYPGNTVIMGIGQGFLQVTPIQLATALSIIAMRGHGFQPHLIAGLYDPKEGQLLRFKPKQLPPVVLNKKSYWKDVIRGMHAVTATRYGTAHGTFTTFPYPVAGKTGTAQVFSLHGNPFKNHRKIPYALRDNALFEAFTPIDKPQLVVVVVCEHAGDKIGPAQVVTRKVFDYWYLHRKDMIHSVNINQLLPEVERRSGYPDQHGGRTLVETQSDGKTAK